MAKTNWTPIIKSIINFLVDLLAKQNKTGSPDKAPSKPGSSGRPKAKPSSKVGAQNTKAKPSHLPQAKDQARGNNNAQTTGQDTPPLSEHYPGDYTGKVQPEYAPELDGNPDPGEIVWTWVPYEEDYNQGKDRPVLLVGNDGPWLLGLMLTSKDHTSSQRSTSRLGPRWIDIGTGPWDAQGRESEIRLDRIIRINPASMRREGAVMPKKLFITVATQL